MENGMTLKEIAWDISQNDERSAMYLYHAALVAVRALDIYDRGRLYTLAEAERIWDTINVLFPTHAPRRPRRLRGICR